MLTLEALHIVQDDFSLTADLVIETRARVAVIGPSGAGKSTLLASIAGFLAPASGRILWNGTDITETSPGARPLSMVFQDNNLFPHLTAFQNVAIGLSPALKLGKQDRTRVSESLERVGLAGFELVNPVPCPADSESRVALARVLLRAKPLLLLDEPFSALGPALKADMLDLLAEVAVETGGTVLMVTHDPQDALRFASVIVLVAEGRAEPPHDTQDLLRNPPPALSGYLGQA